MPRHSERRDSQSVEYVPLKPRNGKSESGPRPIEVTRPMAFLLMLALVFISGLSYAAGKHASGMTPQNILNLQSSPRIFKYNSSFGAQPNVTTNKVWLDLFPTQGGFFKHPKYAPERSAFAVFHQLHCLDGLRRAYWSLHDMAASGTHADTSTLPHHASPQHVSHCIDLLRNALVCQPDLTLEIASVELDGVTGFGTEHMCVDWEKLVGWTEEWELWELKETDFRGNEDSSSEPKAAGSSGGL